MYSDLEITLFLYVHATASIHISSHGKKPGNNRVRNVTNNAETFD